MGWLWSKPKEEERDAPTISLNDWANMFDFGLFGGLQYQGLNYPFGLQQSLQGKIERVHGNFSGFTRGAYKGDSAIYACMAVRRSLFSEARLQFRHLEDGRPGDLFDR